MSSLKTKQLLSNVAKEHESSKRTFSKKEIKDKINEIKYLSSQKTVPKLSLRKEIMHLERKLESVFEIEKKLLKSKKSENSKVQSLKRQIMMLKKRLQSTQDEELRKKVAKLSHLLGDALAKSDSQKDIELSKNILGAVDDIEEQRKNIHQNNQRVEHRIRLVMNRLHMLKQELELNKKLEKGDPKQIQKITQGIGLLEKNLEMYKTKFPHLRNKFTMVPEQPKKVVQKEAPKMKEGEFPNSNIKHNVLFKPVDEETIIAGPKPSATTNLAQKIDPQNAAEHFAQKHIEIDDTGKIQEEMIEELPLPPPPKIIKKK